MTRLFRFLSLLSLILFYVILVLGLFSISAEVSEVLKPDSVLAKFWGFEPIYGNFDIYFHHFPDLYNDLSFRLLNLLSIGAAFLFSVLVLWYLHKLFKNIYMDNLFTYENVSVIFKIGVVILVVGTGFSVMNGILELRAINALQIKNAEIGFSNLSYIDFVITGIVLMIVSISLKKAVRAVEENNDTI